MFNQQHNDDAYQASIARWQARKPQRQQQPTEQETKPMNNKNLKTCKTCGNQVAKTAKKCPHCGAKLRWGFFEKVIGGVVVVSVFSSILGHINAPARQKQENDAFSACMAKGDNFRFDRPKTKCFEKGTIYIGMSRENLLWSFGEPHDINTSVGSWGKHEQLIYQYDIKYVYVDNDFVRSWQSEK